MKRVLVLGSPGSGKSTLARRLGAAAGLPIHHLDAEFWRPGWVESERDAFAARVAEIAAGERWIIDGNYARTLPMRLARADTVLWLDVSRQRCALRVMWRVCRGIGRVRRDMAPACPERLNPGFLRYVWRFPDGEAGRLIDLVQVHGHAPVRLRGSFDLEAFLATTAEGVEPRPARLSEA